MRSIEPLEIGPAALLAAAGLLAILAGSVPPTVALAEGVPAAPQGAVYVGSDTCITCHDGYDTGLEGTPHGRAAFAALSKDGCETCHGPGSAHAENPDDPALRPRLDRRPVAQQNDTCRGCHRGGEQFFWQGGTHETRGLSCLTCHSVHSPAGPKAQLKAASAEEQCFGCHKNVRAETFKASHHPIREGKIGCADCHNPHGSSQEGMLRAASVNDQCYQCHAEKRGPFLWEHAPVRESCLNCHTPHGSNHLKLQRSSVPFICQQCHANTRHPGTMYDGSFLAGGARASNREFNRACLDCHAAVHGSNHPSSPYLAH
jgi:DmsE family decaheme c-type cytochrome